MTEKEDLKEGETVEIINGFFKGKKGTICDIDEGHVIIDDGEGFRQMYINIKDIKRIS